jgi:hypothetical protein
MQNIKLVFPKSLLEFSQEKSTDNLNISRAQTFNEPGVINLLDVLYEVKR